ncbi:MAG: hypothetical protein QXM37_00140 [Candidatus Bathyarchaeia archaeon]
MKKINSPKISEINREPFLHPIFLGGIGMYQTKAHISRKRKRLKPSTYNVLNTRIEKVFAPKTLARS